LYRRKGPAGQIWNVSVHHKTLGYLGWGAFVYFGQAQHYFNFLAEDWVMGKKLTQKDRAFLRECGIDSGLEQKRIQLDGTQRLLMECGADPFNRADYLMLAFAGKPPAELDGEIEAMLPENLRDEINNAPSAGECGEPSHEPTETDDED
jgi:hypothetical protein